MKLPHTNQEGHVGRKIFLCLMLIVGLSGCATVGDQVKWVALGANHSGIQQWKATGFTPEETKSWLQDGFSFNSAKKWNSIGVKDPKEAREWIDRGMTLSALMEYHSAGVKLDDVKVLNEAKVWYLYAIKMSQAGCNVAETIDWYRNGPHVHFPEDVNRHAEWRKAGFTRDEAIAWSDAGFTPGKALPWKWKTVGGTTVARYTAEEAQRLVKDNFTSPEEVDAWEKAGFKPDDAKEWLGNGSVEAAISYKKEGLSYKEATEWSDNQFNYLEEILPWRKAGFNPKSAARWKELGCSTPAEAQAKRKSCPNGVGTVADLYQANPYDVSGKCFECAAETLQLISRTAALFNFESKPIYIDFGERSAPTIYTGIVKGVGTYDYIDTIGRKRIVPRLRAI